MCVAPITIPNPYYQIGDKGLNFLHDTVNSHIQVPCGKCHQCCSLRQAYFNQRVQMESLRSEIFMITLTYRDEAIRKTNIGDYKCMYPDYTDIQNMFKRIRKKVDYPIRYAFVSEYGSRRRRPHFHGLIAIQKDTIFNIFKGSVSYAEQQLSKLFLSNWQRNIGSRRNPDYKNLCIYIRGRNGRSTFDFHWVQPLRNHDNDVSFYVSKYVLKFDDRTEKLLKKIKFDPSLDDQQTSELLSLLKPRLVMSKDFGDARYPAIKEYITKCIEKDETDIPQYYDLYTGQPSLLSRYYRKHCLSINHALTRFYFSSSGDSFSSHFDDDGSVYDWTNEADLSLRDSSKFRKIKNILDHRCDFD